MGDETQPPVGNGAASQPRMPAATRMQGHSDQALVTLAPRHDRGAEQGPARQRLPRSAPAEIAWQPCSDAQSLISARHLMSVSRYVPLPKPRLNETGNGGPHDRLIRRRSLPDWTLILQSRYKCSPAQACFQPPWPRTAEKIRSARNRLPERNSWRAGSRFRAPPKSPVTAGLSEAPSAAQRAAL